MKGNIFNIARASLHDGTGIRTVVYFKGCSLKCVWCHNPEGISPEKEMMYYKNKCISCGRCVNICPENHNENGYVRTSCSACGKCADVCPNNAMVMCGQLYDTDSLYDEIKKDKHYYDISGGGVTFSGGECFLQPGFLRSVAEKCRRNGINTAAESALNFKTEYLDIAVDEIDSMIVDLKCIDTVTHKTYTGCENEQILKNIYFLSNNHKDVTVRVPMIPSVNDTEYNLTGTAEFLNRCGGGIRKVELLKYNNLSAGKYEVLGRTDGIFKATPQNDDEMNRYCEIIKKTLRKDIIV